MCFEYGTCTSTVSTVVLQYSTVQYIPVAVVDQWKFIFLSLAVCSAVDNHTVTQVLLTI